MTRKRILVIDDSVVLLKALSIKLRTHGYEVLTAVDSAGAVSAVRRQRPDLVLLDIDFPPDSWDGFAMLNWLRRMDEAKDIPVMVITGGELTKYKDRCHAAGVSDFFLKPIDHEELLTAIDRTLKPQGEEEQLSHSPMGKKVLFVDDENDWRYMATLYLTDAGYEVVTAGDATEALAQMERVRPDVVI